jgi:Cu(I)/Ag(I) efflux system membrane fusion protein
MKRILPIIIIVIIIFAGWFFFFNKGEKTTARVKPESVTLKKHSAEFDNQITTLIDSYMAMKNAFVDGDTSEIKAKTGNFIIVADSLNLNELQEKDSSVYLAVKQNVSDIKANASPILEENNITEMRHDFSMVSENLYPFLKTINYEGGKLYWQNCPMAFGEDKPANWLSNTAEINNPYLGKNDPAYKSGMLHCGENMDSIYLK